MSTPLAETVVAHGRLNAAFFRADNVPGDWQSFSVTFSHPFPGDDVRVVATASSDGVDTGLGTMPVVPVIHSVTRNGFTIRARNSDCSEGSAGLHWIAVLERPGARAPRPVDVRLAQLPARYSAADCYSGDWNSWGYTFGNPLGAHPTVVATPTRRRGDHDLDVFTLGAFASSTIFERIPTLVGVVHGTWPGGVNINARNGGGWPGRAGVNLAAVVDGSPAMNGLMVDSGVTGTVSLPRSGGNFAARLDVHFALPFQTPPIVLLTAIGPSTVALVGTAQDVSPFGFTVEAMNTDSAAGSGAFHWIAIGCGVHCGAGASRAPITPPIGGGAGSGTGLNPRGASAMEGLGPVAES